MLFHLQPAGGTVRAYIRKKNREIARKSGPFLISDGFGGFDAHYLGRDVQLNVVKELKFQAALYAAFRGKRRWIPPRFSS